MVEGDTPGAIKLIDEVVAYKEKEVKDFETWAEEEHKLEQSGVEEQYNFRFEVKLVRKLIDSSILVRPRRLNINRVSFV